MPKKDNAKLKKKKNSNANYAGIIASTMLTQVKTRNLEELL